MRIAMLANMYGPKSGGIKTTLNSLSQQYEKLGHEVLVITPSDKDFVEQVGFIKKVSIASPSIPYTGGYRIIVRSKKIIEVLNSFHPDIIEISDRTTLISVARWARGKKIPTVFFAHERLDGVLSAFLPRFPFRRLLITNWNRLTNRIFTRIVATTEYAAFEFKKIKSQK